MGKALVSRQSWSWTTLPRKPVYVKATKPLAHSHFSFFPVNQKLTSDSCCRTPSPPSQNTQEGLTLPQELWFLSLEAMSCCLPLELRPEFSLEFPWCCLSACLSVCGIKNSSNKLFILQWLVSVASWSSLNFHSPKGEWRDFNMCEKLCKIFCWSLEWT